MITLSIILAIILSYLTIGYIIRLIARKKLIKESFQLLSDREYNDSLDEIYRKIMKRVEKVELEYNFSPVVMYVLFWPITMIVLALKSIFNFLDNIPSKIEEKMAFNEIKKYKKSNPQKFI